MIKTACGIDCGVRYWYNISHFSFFIISSISLQLSTAYNLKCFENLFKSNLVEIIWYEANLNEYLKLQNKTNKKYFNYCLGDGTERILYITRYPGCTSLYEPNPEIIN